jgi:LysM repeat protein
VQYRSPARFLAPVAVVVAASSVYLIVHSGVSDEPATAKPAAARTTAVAPSSSASARASYVVRTGDTLSAISERTGIPLGDLQQLNPSIDANSLHAGQKLRLRKRQTS